MEDVDNGIAETQDVGRVERQLIRGSLFTHTALSQNADRIHEVEAFLYGLIDVLMEKGLLTQDELLLASQNVRTHLMEQGQTLDPNIALRVDSDDDGQAAFKPVNCAERIHICKAVCCKLNFALSAPEVESGVVKWDLGSPYFIRQETTGYCTHLNEHQGCSIYTNRPSVCRRYSCADDERIWTDFENMALNEAWIHEHIGADKLVLISQQMLPQSSVSRGRPASATSETERVEGARPG